MNDYPPGADPGRWTSCPDCDELVPCDVSGEPYPHSCKG